MNMFIAFVKKEFLEHWRNYKLLILLVIMLLFGMTSPLLAKLTPEILKSVNMGEGIQILLPPPTYLDAYAQFFKNMTQMCMIVVILIFSNNVTQERQKGTALLLFAKGLPKDTFVLSKFFAQLCIWTVCYVLSVLVFNVYSHLLFPEQSPLNAFWSFFALWWFVVMILAALQFSGVLFASGFLPLLFTFGLWGVLSLLAIFPDIKDINPTLLTTINLDLISGKKSLSDLWPALAVTGGLTVVLIGWGLMIFRKKEM